MRSSPLVVLLALAVAPFAGACGLEQLLNSGSTAASTDGGSSEAAAAADAGVTGQGCGVDSASGAQLCRATSACPSVVVDSETFPHCGFRIRGAAVDLVCGCSQALCSMGTYTTCAQAANLLTTQTEQGVCVQVAEGRCADVTTTTSSSSGSSSSSTSSSASSSGASGSSTCDKQCLADCGGGAACAGVCGC